MPGAKTKAYEEIADFSSYEPGHPTSSEQAQAESTMERDKGAHGFPTFSIILKVSHCPRSETCFVLNPMIHTLGPNPQRCHFQLVTGQTFNLRAI